MKPIVRHPRAEEQWRDAFRSFSLRVGFHLSLTKPMLEFLCAVADGVQWDRSLYFSERPVPDNWIASERALEKRGLIARKAQGELDSRKYEDRPPGEWCCCVLTPAGKAVVELVKLAGLFVEADAAINRRSRRKQA